MAYLRVAVRAALCLWNEWRVWNCGLPCQQKMCLEEGWQPWQPLFVSRDATAMNRYVYPRAKDGMQSHDWPDARQRILMRGWAHVVGCGPQPPRQVPGTSISLITPPAYYYSW